MAQEMIEIGLEYSVKRCAFSLSPFGGRMYYLRYRI
jgi:hypothetical protein